jgi:hypothetical protein
VGRLVVVAHRDGLQGAVDGVDDDALDGGVGRPGGAGVLVLDDALEAVSLEDEGDGDAPEFELLALVR